MELKKIKVTGNLKGYRNMVLGLPLKDYRALQAGKEALIPIELFKKRKDLFTEVRESKK